MRNKKNPATSGTPPESAEPGTPRINPEKYYKDSGMYEHFKNSGITIRFTNSAEALKRQQAELWKEYLERCKAQYEKEGAKIENSDIEIFRHGFIENEVKLFTGFLGQTQPERNKAETRKYLNEVTKELEQLNAHTPDPPAPDQEPKQIKNFIAHLTMDERKKQPFADQIKMKFPAIKGTKLGMLLGAMEAKGWICIGTRTELYYSIRQFFGWNICSDAMLNRVMSNLPCKTKEIQQYQTIIENIYNSIV